VSAPSRPNPMRRSPAFRRLWLARAISQVGNGIALVALVLLVQGTEGTGTAVGGLLLASSLPRFLGPLAGVVSDRVEQRTLMVLCDLGNAGIFAAIVGFEPSFSVLLMLVAASAILDTLFAPAGRSAIPALVHADDLLQANAWMGTSLNLQVALGTLVGGALVATIGIRGALTFDALSFVLSAALLIGLPAMRSSTPTESPAGFLTVGKEGLAFAWRDRVVRTFVIVLFLGVAFAAVDNVALVFLVRETLGGGAVAFGFVSAAFGMGMIAASISLSIRGTSFAVTTLLIAAWLASGIGTIATGLAPLIIVVALAQTVAGIGNGLQNVAADTLIQHAVPREMLGRIFGLVSTAAFGGSTLAYAVGGPLLDFTSARAVFILAGTGVLTVTAFLWNALRHAVR
jgi:MFS family permease